MKDIKLPIPCTENEQSQFPFYPSGSSIILSVPFVVNDILDVQVRATIQDGLLLWIVATIQDGLSRQLSEPEIVFDQICRKAGRRVPGQRYSPVLRGQGSCFFNDNERGALGARCLSFLSTARMK